MKVYIVHDVTSGRISSVGRLSEGVKAIPLSGEGRSVIETEVEESIIQDLVTDGGKVDTAKGTVVAHRTQ